MLKERFQIILYDKLYKNCFLHLSKYINGDLKISIFGEEPEISQTAHFMDITLEQNSIELEKNQIVVDNYLKNDLIKQLKELGILKREIGTCIVECIRYPIYEIKLKDLQKFTYEMEQQNY